MTKVHVIQSERSWIEGEAIRQLENVAELPSIIEAIGMPDLHPGMGCPVGAVFVTDCSRIYPHLIGSDIGCGMAFFGTSVKPIKPERIAKKLKASLERGVEEPLEYLSRDDEPFRSVQPCGFESTLGTVGRGNHFAEILAIDEIRDPAKMAPLEGFNSFLLVHSGSRGYGEQILYEHTAKYQAQGLNPNSPEGVEYLAKHTHACDWANANRMVIADRIFDALGANGKIIHEAIHNFMRYDGNGHWIHRKGAIPTRMNSFGHSFGHSLLVIPGSRGSHTYVVEAIGDQQANWHSVSHGAGRKMSRRDARIKFNHEQDSIAKLERTKFGSVVICEDRALLMEEAPEAYKPIDRVIQDLVDNGIVSVVALLKPVVTYKMRRTGED